MTSTPWSRSSVTRARAPSGDVDVGVHPAAGPRRGQIRADAATRDDDDQRATPRRAPATAARRRTDGRIVLESSHVAQPLGRPRRHRWTTVDDACAERRWSSRLGDHPVRRFGAGPLAVGDVIESGLRRESIRRRDRAPRVPASRASSVAVRPGTGSRTPFSSSWRATARRRWRIAAAQLPAAAGVPRWRDARRR